MIKNIEQTKKETKYIEPKQICPMNEFSRNHNLKFQFTLHTNE